MADGLHDLFDRATDSIESPALAALALQTARRRRARRRGAAAAALTSGIVVAVVVATQIGVGTSAGPSPSTSTPPAVPTDSSVTVDEQPAWDPRTVDDLPAAAPSVAPALPATIDPPDTAPDLEDSPVGAAVLAVELDGTVMLLGTDGSWRSLQVAAPYPRVTLSPAGTRLAVYHYADTGAGVSVHDLSTGEVVQRPYPDGYEGWDFTSWSFVDEDTLLLDDLAGGFLVDVESGSSERVPYPETLGWAMDPSGVVVDSADVGEPPVLTDWAGGQPRRVEMSGTLERIQADADTVVGTSYDGRPYSVVVVDRRTSDPTAVLPVRDPAGNYSGGGLSVLALADDGTVLLSVSAYARRAYAGVRLVAWEPGTGELSLVSSASLPVEADVVVADGLVRGNQGAPVA